MGETGLYRQHLGGCLAGGVGGHRHQRLLLADGQALARHLAVDLGRAHEDDSGFRIGGPGRFEDAQRPFGVDAEAAGRVRPRLPHVRQGGKVIQDVGPVRRDGAGDGRQVCDVEVWLGGEHVVAGFVEVAGEPCPHEAVATGDERPHRSYARRRPDRGP